MSIIGKMKALFKVQTLRNVHHQQDESLFKIQTLKKVHHHLAAASTFVPLTAIKI